MSSASSWEITIDNKAYSLSYDMRSGEHIVTVNGTPIVVKEHISSFLLGFDEKFIFNGIEARLLVKTKSSMSPSSRFDYIPEIVINNVLQTSKKKYVKRENLLWMLAVAAVCAILSIWGGEWFLLAYVVFGVLAFRYKPSSLTVIGFIAFLIVAIFACSMLLFFVGGYMN